MYILLFSTAVIHTIFFVKEIS
ncbi:hypothetical protein PFUGPA_03266 [Plasmodium falciparum Palo Alto/Uganda]|uniref:Uncharacterized protein n=1 Tax=Plasmodium falciparum (isolate Palo Alto / Uganda) TaxID=57270 RepID=W4IZ90_PLAFP|nr:hypothetical protein PFUGPA_03266 [Plasmodium falciparum Palo Alto/Uganda]